MKTLARVLNFLFCAIGIYFTVIFLCFVFTDITGTPPVLGFILAAIFAGGVAWKIESVRGKEMRYKIFVSDGHDCEAFYCADKSKAELLYRMAVASDLFTYVSLSEVMDEDFVQKEWSSND